MTDHSRNALLGMCSALREIVQPGVGEDDPLARQELAMVIRYLEFLTERIDLLHDRAVFELSTAETLASEFIKSGFDVPPLKDVVERARGFHSTPSATTQEVRRATDNLNEALSATLRDGYANADPEMRRLERLVLASATRISLFERAWYAPLGMDQFTEDLPPLQDLLPEASDDVGACA